MHYGLKINSKFAIALAVHHIIWKTHLNVMVYATDMSILTTISRVRHLSH